ncbi:MAG: 5-formyltetrahydrofolate cyclo-ligase [Frankiaceae bacterium]|jgi:5-formyltetrahydrofolate cyclo-ligase|nr:5-formyltetrahydrofolate cyclo-ligase [Frankiaceae bacterium]
MLAPVGGPGDGNDILAAKGMLRNSLLAARSSLPAAERAALGAALAARVLALPEVGAAAVVAAFVGTGSEPPTLPLLDVLRERGVVVLLPVLLPGNGLAWGGYDGSLVEGRRGLLEPPAAGRSLADADVVLVPGVAYDASGGRLGRGGGSYDRALAAVSAPVVGLGYDGEVVDRVPVEPHDVRVDVVVTPGGVLRVRPGT